MRAGAAALAAVLCVASGAACDTESGGRRPPNFDATPPDLGPQTPVDASGDRMEASSSTLADGRVVTELRAAEPAHDR